MKISVIVPIYNVESYVRQCIQSILDQSIKDIEIILVNDGSTDNSICKIQDLIDTNNNIILINQENKGLSAARNTGLKYAKGKYIAFIDSDDYVDTFFLERLYSEAETYDLDVACGGYSKLVNNTITPKLRKNELLKLGVIDGTTYLHKQFKLNDYRMEVWDDLYKRSFLMKYKLSFSNGLLHEDEDFTPSILLHAKRVKLVDSYGYIYRYRDNSIMNSKISFNNINSCGIILNKFINLYNLSENDKKKNTISELIYYLVNIYTNKMILSKYTFDKQLLKNYKKWNINQICQCCDKWSSKSRIKYIILHKIPKIYFIFYKFIKQR